MFEKNQQKCWSADKGSQTERGDPAYWVVDYQHGIVNTVEERLMKTKPYVRGVRSALADVQTGGKELTPIPNPKAVDVGSQLANTKIAFMSVHDKNWEVSVINADGSNPTRLTGGEGWSVSIRDMSQPVWSPDRTKIAFGLSDRTINGLYVIDADGSNLRRLTDDRNRSLNQPAWSPDGTKIAFTLWETGASCVPETYVMNADGSNRRRVIDIGEGCLRSHSRERSLAWAPDGTKLALLSRSESSAIQVTNADGTEPRGYGPSRDLPNVGRLSWSPDGTKIALASNPLRDDTGTYMVMRIYVMNADGTNLKQLLQIRDSYEDSSGLNAGGLSWSPDGTQIVFVSRGNNWDIYVVNADGTNLRRLTNTPADNVQPVWSPEGTKIAFASKRFGNWQIYVMNADGTNLRRLTNIPAGAQWPSWSPFHK
jgi:TolB protein